MKEFAKLPKSICIGFRLVVIATGMSEIETITIRITITNKMK